MACPAFLEQGTGIEPAFTAWEAVVLPIYEPCEYSCIGIIAKQTKNFNLFLSINSANLGKNMVAKSDLPCYNTACVHVAQPFLCIGMSPSGKAPDFDSGIRRFKSCHPSHMTR